MKTVEVEFWIKIRVRRTIRLTEDGINTLSAVSEPSDEDGKQYIDEAYENLLWPDMSNAYGVIEKTKPIDEIKIENDNYIEQIKWRVINDDEQ